MSLETISMLADIAQIVSVVPLTAGATWISYKFIKRIRITLDEPPKTDRR